MVSKRLTLSLKKEELNFCSRIEFEMLKIGIPLRWYISSAKPQGDDIEITVEAVIDDNHVTETSAEKQIPQIGISKSGKNTPVIVHVVPTGVQAAIGGSLGDAMPANILLSKIGTLVAHPNTCNGGPLLLADRKSFLYVEGYTLDEWMKGNNLLNAENNDQKIGVIVDSGVNDQWVLNRTCNAVNGFYAHTGANIVGIQKTKDSVGASVYRSEDGAFTGSVENLETVFDAAQKLIDKGANRLAIFTHVKVKNDDWVEYFKGNLPNPVGGVEAIISHSVSKKFNIISAHGPLVTKEEELFMQSVGQVTPEAALEAADPFYLWCVLRGLQESPDVQIESTSSTLSVKDVSVVICPASTLGGIPMLKAEENNISIIAIKQNKTVLGVNAESLNFKNVIEVSSYVHAAGLLLMAKDKNDYSIKCLESIIEKDDVYQIGISFLNGIGINPDSVTRPLPWIPIFL